MRRFMIHCREKMSRLVFEASQEKRLCTGIQSQYHTEKQLYCSKEAQENAEYENAVNVLQSLVSNFGQVEKTKKSKALVEAQVQKTKNYLQRTGLTRDEINKLSVIHVSGTKGKGSTCAFSEQILSCHGYKTGLFTSPHLFEVRERIRINGRPISKEKFCKYFWSVYNKLKDTEVPFSDDGTKDMPFFFAFLTIMSIHVFLKEGVDVAIMEVGIGGQYDTTNVFEAPVVCGVTALGMDHTNILGKTIEEIAWNKAGIFKIDRPAITVPQKDNAMQVLLDRAREIKSPLYVSSTMPRDELNKLHVDLGIDCEKQAENACLAVQLSQYWMKLHSTDKLAGQVPNDSNSVHDIPKLWITKLDDTTVKGLSSCVWHGRTETITRNGITYYLDGAHTKESMQVCTRWFKQKANDEKLALGGKKVARLLIFNTTGERNVSQFFSLLKDCDFDVAIFCTNQFSSVSSLNKPDQIYSGVSFKKLLDKARNNKALWDSVASSSLSVSNSAPSLSNGSGDAAVDFMTTSEQVSEEPTRAEALDCNSNIPQAPCFIHETADTCSNSKSKTNGFIRTEAFMSENDERANFVEVSSSDELQAGSSIEPTTELIQSYSLALPCILDALAWASQGRDPSLKLSKDDLDLPGSPKFLEEAEHIQILITGSLHLVGGTLEALAPDIND